MINAKRSVSPLIATILLVALTVSIGAMIIGWGRQYVQQQTACLEYSIQIIETRNISEENVTLQDQNYTFLKLELIIENTGRRALSKNLLGDAFRFVYTTSTGLVHSITWKSGINITYMNDELTDTIEPNEILLAKMYIEPNAVRGYFDLKGCGKISNEWIKI